MSEALERGEFEVVWGMDLEQVRGRTGLDRATFAQRFELPVEELVGWEAAARVPSRAVWTYLKVIEREPELVGRAAEAIQRELLVREPVA